MPSVACTWPSMVITPAHPKALIVGGGIAGLAAAIVAGAQIAGGLMVSRLRRLFSRRFV